MASTVFANGMEVSCKAASGKTICAFPDVCFTPPQTPATPPGVPIPYPNTGLASDTTKGSKKVKIGCKEVGLKNKSHFKKSMGDEAGCAPKKGIITSNNRGKVYFNSWSMDVKIEGQNAVRHFDLTTNNHASMPGDTPTWPYIDTMAVAADSEDPCHNDHKKERAACSDLEEEKPDGSVNLAATKRNICADTPEAAKCRTARKCMLASYDKSTCCPKSSPFYSQPHHLVEDHWVKDNDAFPWYRSLRTAGNEKPTDAERDAGIRTDCDAPCVCADGDKWREEHGEFHVLQGLYEQSFMPGGSRENKPWDYQAAKRGGSMAHSMVCEGSDCNPDCIEAQLDNFYGDDPDRPLNEPHRIPPNDDPARGWTESEGKQYINPDRSVGTFADVWG